MSEHEVSSGATGRRPAGPLVKMVFHPTLHVVSLDETEAWFERVFGRTTQPMMVMPRSDTPPQEGDPTHYSRLTMISDVLIDNLDPKCYLVNGVQGIPTVDEPVLQNVGWYVNDIDETFRALKRNGIRIVTQFGEPADDGDEPPNVSQGGAMKMFFTTVEDRGLRYQFLPTFPLPLDPRHEPDWVVPPVSDDDPLGIEHCSHHVILSEAPERAVHLLVDALGGSVIHEGRDEVRGVAGPYVHLADAVFHVVVPDEGTPAHDALAAKTPADRYHALTWKVVDLDRVARHLEAQGVEVQARSDDTIVTTAATGLGVPWGFTTGTTPGDPR